MRKAFDPTMLAVANAVQLGALRPHESVWIGASAGTGKTEVLTRRMLALLLADFTLQPRQILALTFTKAGAAEMAARLPKRLAEWAALRDDEIAARIRDELGMAVPDGAAGRVRDLAATVRQGPPLVATIHALAQQILTRFAVEAGVPPRFEVLDDVAQKRLVREAQHGLLVDAPVGVAESLAVLLDELGEHGWRELSGLMGGAWARLAGLLNVHGVEGLLATLRRALGLEGAVGGGVPIVPSADEWAVLRRCAGILPDKAEVRAVLEAAEAQVEKAWRALLLTQSDTPRARLLVKAEVVAVGEADVAVLQAAAGRVAEAVRLRKVWRGYEVTRALIVWSAAVRASYTQRKVEAGVLDYADLLDGLERLLARADAGLADWVWYGLDRKFRHLLLDEGQDNNAQQDRVVRWLARSILSGDVGEDSRRTVLAVGDVKQSIFRFQGAVPQQFLELQEALQRWAGSAYRPVEMTHNFRSGAAVLAAVDAVFSGTVSGAVQGEEGRDWPGHTAVAAGGARVEVWPLVPKGESPRVEPWALPWVRAEAGGDGARIVCFRQIGAWLKEQVARGVVMPSTGKPLTFDDVMVVVQRNEVGGTLAGVWRAMGIEVAAAGGVVPLVVKDVAAGVRVVFNPADNLALAQVLKGLRGWDDARLLELAARAGDGMWSEFVEGADGAWLRGYLAMRDEAPLRVLQALVNEVGGDVGMFAGLLGWAAGAAHMRALVERLEAEEIPAGGGGRGVRVLTVHGAKGLQAPLVILPDTMVPLGEVSARDKLLWGEDAVLFRQGAGTSTFEDGLLAQEEVRRREDNLRGLYVAMTRAEDWLVVAGFGEASEKTQTWWTLVHDAVGDGVGEALTETAVGVVEDGVGVEIPAWVGEVVGMAVAEEAPDPARVRGELVHALLEGVRGLSVPEDVAAEAAGVKAAHAWLWAAGTRGEVSVSLGGGAVGRIDRLAEKDGEVWVVDFKTGRVPDVMPEAYAAQVRGYMAAVRASVGDKRVRGAIVWTAAARLEEIQD